MTERTTSNTEHGEAIAATGSIVGAVLASSCCIAPLVMIALGASGPWIGKLTALKAYQPVFATLTMAFLGYGFWRVYGAAARSRDATCATPVARQIVKTVLWGATALVAAALTTDYWAPFFY